MVVWASKIAADEFLRITGSTRRKWVLSSRSPKSVDSTTGTSAEPQRSSLLRLYLPVHPLPR